MKLFILCQKSWKVMKLGEKRLSGIFTPPYKVFCGKNPNDLHLTLLINRRGNISYGIIQFGLGKVME